MRRLLAIIFAVTVPINAAAKGAEVAIVGLHLRGYGDEQAVQAADDLARAVDATGTLQAIQPGEVRARLAGREPLVVEGAFLSHGRRLLDEGRVLYERADFEAAIPSLQDAVHALEGGLAGTTSTKDLIDALLLLGLAQASLGEPEAAIDAFSRVVMLDPTRELDPINFPPKILRSFDAARASVLDRPRARLNVDAPEDARVYIDGNQLLDPTAQIPPGVHYVLIVGADGRRSFERTVLDPGHRYTIQAHFKGRVLAAPGQTDRARSEQIGLLYQSLGAHAQTPLIILGGELDDDNVALQLYETHTGNFSKIVSASVDGDPVGAITDLVPTLANYVTDQGTLRSDRVGHRVASLYISDNALLASMLLDPDPIVETVTVTQGPPWYLWAGVGVVAAAGATATVIAIGSGGDGGGGDTTDPDQGVVIVGPFP